MSTQFTIEKNIPVPPLVRGDAGKVANALSPMEIGDSFVFEDGANKSQQRLIKYAAKRLGFRMTVRRTSEGQYRAWRIE